MFFFVHLHFLGETSSNFEWHAATYGGSRIMQEYSTGSHSMLLRLLKPKPGFSGGSNMGAQGCGVWSCMATRERFPEKPHEIERVGTVGYN